MHADKSITAYSKQLIVTGGVSLHLDSAAPKSSGKYDKGHACVQRLNAACLQTPFCEHRAWHGKDNDIDHEKATDGQHGMLQ